MASLEGIDLKLGRAQEHLDALDLEVRRYVESRPYAVVREYDPTDDWKPRGLRIVEPPRCDGALWVGDYLYNIRSALDHLAWQLVLANGNEPGRQTEFPIFKDSGPYQDRVGGKTAGMEPEAVALIEGLQPYHCGDRSLDHPLWLLHDLNRIDKHQTLLLAGVWVTEAIEFEAKLSDDTQAQVFFFEQTRIPTKDEVHAYAQRMLQVTLAEPARLRQRPVVALLREQIEFVRERVLARLKPFLN